MSSIKKQRIDLLFNISQLEEKCEDCPTHVQYSKKRDIAGLTNACKACPIGRKISEYGNELIELVNPRKTC